MVASNSKQHQSRYCCFELEASDVAHRTREPIAARLGRGSVDAVAQPVARKAAERRRCRAAVADQGGACALVRSTGGCGRNAGALDVTLTPAGPARLDALEPGSVEDQHERYVTAPPSTAKFFSQ
jgi:hypothetical protein